MSWKKFFSTSPGPKSSGTPGIAHRNYGSYLPEVYSGHPNRIERYYQYESMDTDSEVNSALDILAEFCTQNDNQNNLPFKINYKEKATDVEINILNSTLQKWCNMNEFKKRTFRLFRNTLKYGDQFFIRDPETFEWYWIDPTKVDKIIVNEAEGKEPECYIIRDLNLNRPSLQATQQNSSGTGNAPGNGPYTGSAYTNIRGGQFTGSSSLGGRFDQSANQYAVKAEHVIHLSLSEGLDANWPFGNSILEYIYKVYKQKELLEDAVIIYRVQRAPERRVFYIDVGNMPTNLAMAFVERVKNEIWQRRLPSLSGGGTSVIDAGYNPLSINEDYFFPQTADGRGSKVETLPGGQNLGEIDDLKFFTNKLFRALRIPSSYMPTGPDDSGNTVNDGKVGTALIQELRFNKYCERLQNLLSPVVDKEFKLYLKLIGLNVDSSLFDIEFNEPMNFAKYRQLELDTAQSSVYANVVQIPHLSKRFGLKRFLGLTEEEIRENEELWMEENDPEKLDAANAVGADLRSVGVTGGALESDIEAESPPAPPPEEIGAPTAELSAPIPTAPTAAPGGPGGAPGGGIGV
jgi:hypothetical protein